MTSTQSRTPAGVPTGGQFATSQKAEARVVLPPRSQIAGIEIPDGWAPAPNRYHYQDFVIVRTVGTITAKIWEIHNRPGRFQYDVLDQDYRRVGPDRDYWCEDLDEAVSETERLLGVYE